MYKAHSQKKTKNFHITSITLETDSDSCKSDNDSFQLCERCNNGFSKAYYEELKNKTSKFPFTYSSKKKFLHIIYLHMIIIIINQWYFLS